MNDKEKIQSLKSWKKAGTLAEHRSELVQHIRELSTTSAWEKVGNLLKDVAYSDWSSGEQQTDLKPLRIAILSNFTCDALAHFLRTLLLPEGMWAEVYTANFDQYVFEIINEHSELYQFAPDLTICLLDEHVILDDLRDGWSVEDFNHMAQQKSQQLRELVSLYVTRSTGLFVLNTVPFSTETHQVILDYKTKAKLSIAARLYNIELLQLADTYKQVLILDLESMLQSVATPALRDPRFAYFAGMYLYEEVLAKYAQELVKIGRARLGLTKKCLVLDADNTLWGGIIGDDSLNGIQLGDAGTGKIFADFQKKIKHLSQQGVLLTINSKNEEQNVLEVLDEHPDMKLRRENFVMVTANWEPKHQNIQHIASTLNIGVDSFVFVDDNPFERNIVREFLPMVTVPEMPEDPAQYVQTLLEGGWFNTLELTEEDKSRTGKYKQQAETEALRQSTGSVEQFLDNLNIGVHLLAPDTFNLPRLAQLNVRTNQFNMTTRRYAESEMTQMAQSDSFLLVGFRSTDRFGDNGIVGSVIVEKVQDAAGHETWWIRNFLMSCRVFSRGIETAVLRHVLLLAKQLGATEVYGEYIPTKKNTIVANFYTQHGFEPSGTVGETQEFRHTLQDIVQPVEWLTLHDTEEVTT